MTEQLKAVVFELAASHGILAQAEYNRNTAYNDSHFSAIAEIKLITYLQDNNLLQEFLAYYKVYKENHGVKEVEFIIRSGNGNQD
jgi:hypothetical protein